jgi:hypothetical protein
MYFSYPYKIVTPIIPPKTGTALSKIADLQIDDS